MQELIEKEIDKKRGDALAQNKGRPLRRHAAMAFNEQLDYHGEQERVKKRPTKDDALW